MINFRVKPYRFLFPVLWAAFLLSSSCDRFRGQGNGNQHSPDLQIPEKEYPAEYVLLVSPEIPVSGDIFRIITTGGSAIRKAKISVTGPEGDVKSPHSGTGGSSPCWRLDEFKAGGPGIYRVVWKVADRPDQVKEFRISTGNRVTESRAIPKTSQGWDPAMETLYSAWINALFSGDGEDASWSSLNAVTERAGKNFLFNHLGLKEDDPDNTARVIMQPDCADNPFFLRAYFAWKMGLPFGFHICDRGGLGRSPATGAWVTSESPSGNANPVASFNSFLRKVMNGVQSGTARTGFENEHSDYYPVGLDRNSLRPGVVYADPYGHTLILTGWVQQTRTEPGQLLAVDAQPDGTIGIKRFWKGNFLFNTKEVVGEPGFKAFRPILKTGHGPELVPNGKLTPESGFIPFSMEQRNMESSVFYQIMERLINPDPLDPETAFDDLIKALHGQLQVRVTSVANGEQYMKSHPGTMIPMPASLSAVFQSGGQWEDFSTPNRDLRLLIAMDAVLAFPQKVAENPRDFRISGWSSAESLQQKLQKLLEEKTGELSITYSGSDGTPHQLTLKEILERREAFEMAYNPNDGPEIRWGAPENSAERSACKRKAPPAQVEKMKSLRKWFQKRLHPPT